MKIKEGANLQYSRINISGANNSLDFNCILAQSHLDISGDHNMIELLGNDSKMNMKFTGSRNRIKTKGVSSNLTLRIEGHDNEVIVERGVRSITNLHVVVIGNGLRLRIGEDTTFGSDCWVVLMGNNNHLFIGSNCMIADDVDLFASDTHPILNKESNEIINKSGNIDIDDHVWLGKKACVLKNVCIGKDSVVGMASIVVSNIPNSSVAVGNPAKIVKTGVTWDRKHITI